MPVVTARTSVRYDEVAASDFCLAPSKYKHRTQAVGVKYVNLSDAIVESSAREKCVQTGTYLYAEISDVGPDTGIVSPNSMRGVELPSSSPITVRNGDILVSTVRTYLRGIGTARVAKGQTVVCSPALLVVRDAAKGLSKEWLLAFMRNARFIDQTIANQGMYPRLDMAAAKNIWVVEPGKSELDFVGHLVRGYLRLRYAIQDRARSVLGDIETEIMAKQTKPFVTKPVRLDRLLTFNRMDAGFHSEDCARLLHLLNAYSGSTDSINDLGYSILRGQNLQKSAIGESVYSDDFVPGFRRLIRPTNFSEEGVADKFEWLGNKCQLSLLEEGDVVFSGEGNVGKCIVIDKFLAGSMTNIHGIVLRPKNGKADISKSYFVAAILRWLRHRGLFDHLSVGGQGGSFAVAYWDLIAIPRMPHAVQNKVVAKYANPSFCTGKLATAQNFDNLMDKAVDNAGLIDMEKMSRWIWTTVEDVVDAASSAKSHSCDYDKIFPAPSGP